MLVPVWPDGLRRRKFPERGKAAPVDLVSSLAGETL
jgi:hypothetical protein